MKKLATLVLACLSLSAGAQYYYNYFGAPGSNPGGLNTDAEYPVGGGLPAGWTTIHNPSSSPAWSPSQTIPFSFDFNGSPVTQFMVSNSGVLTFDVATVVAAPSFTNSAIPSASIPDKSVMIWGIDGTGTAAGSADYVVTKTFGITGSRQHWILFSSYTFGSNWTYWSIMLEEGTNNIYIVDQRHSATITNLTVGIQTNSTTAYAVNNGAANVSSAAGSNSLPDDNVFYEFNQGTQPNYDMGATSESVNSNVILSQAPFTIAGTFMNYGAQTVTSYSMNYSVNGGPVITGAIGSVSVPTMTSTSGNHPTGWIPVGIGLYNVSIWASNINGNPDADNSNDTLNFTINVVDTMTVLNTCLEVFTSSSCNPCNPGNANMDNNVVPNISNYTIIKYQQDYPGVGDPYYTAAAGNRHNYYGINSIPRMEIDGQWDGNANSLTTGIYNSYNQEPAFLDIDINTATYTGTTVTIAAVLKPLINYTGSNFRYHVVVVEKQTFNNTATNGETEFHYVMMKMHPSDVGTAVTSLTAGNNVSVNATISMTSTFYEEMSDLRVVIFVQDNSTKKIIQSEWKDITVPIGMEQLDENGEGISSVFPNPANSATTFGVKVNEAKDITWSMTNMVGQQVTTGSQLNVQPGETRFTINTSTMAEGIYFLNVVAGDRTYTQKVVVSH
ncbi:MAG TPA: T9SS type A sorting domain-containing protein [Bacteroidia bacterium]|nr:T9SS type A sorting domain-containing protein [Bacteroidia bacterium]